MKINGEKHYLLRAVALASSIRSISAATRARLHGYPPRGGSLAASSRASRM